MRITLIGLLLLFLSFCKSAVAQPTVAFFYGKEVPVQQLCKYPIVVLDPYSDFNPNEYCNSVSEPLAYVSIGEVRQSIPYEKKISPEWIIGKNAAWNNNKIIDQTQKKWQEFVLNQIITPLWQKGYRGFFLDTLDSYSLVIHDPDLQQKQRNSIIDLIKKIKNRYPNAKIILNRGFELLPSLQSQIYGIVIESLYHGWNQQKQQYEKTSSSEQDMLLTEIKKIKEMKFPIIIIDYLPHSEKNKAVALANQISNQGMIPWITNKDLDQIYLSPQIQELSRRILILFNYENKVPITLNPAVRFLGSILEYMGYIPTYLDINKLSTLQTDDLKSKYAGIILWLESQKTKNDPLYTWIHKQIDRKIPIVFLEGFGIPIESPELKKLGLLSSPFTDSTASLRITKMDKNFVGFETKPLITPYNFFPLNVLGGQVLLQMMNQYQQTEDIVAITPWGGYALTPDVILYLPNGNTFWIINPFEFFHRALHLTDFPVPDTTTENGRRLMSVHIDGDGFAYQAKWVGGRYAALELRDQILKKFPIPTSVSVITGEIGPNGIHPEKSSQLMQAARTIFSLPWVEMASHTFSHPFFWQVMTAKSLNLEGGEPFTLQIPNYKFNLTDEITGSVDFINKNLAPPNKQCHLFFWSGMADPSIQALALTYQDNLLNINGVSDTHITYLHPSVSGIRPMGIELGGYYQVFAPIDMDFYYLNGLLGPMYDYEHVIETLELTDKPRRMKPIDLYYHIYAASFPASLQALIKVYHWALAQPVMNIYISDYIKKVLDYSHISISKNHASWIIYTKGDLRELRSPRYFGYPNFLESDNVIGFKENKDGIYIHLGPSRITVLNYQKEIPTEPYLVDANARISSFSRGEKTLVIKFDGYMPLQFTLANVTLCHVSSQSALTTRKNPDKTITYTSKKESDEIYINC